jgi:hypothetical protein
MSTNYSISRLSELSEQLPAYDLLASLHDRRLTGSANGYDPDGDAITAQLVSGPANGTLTFHPDGTFTYTPNTYYVGTDSFTYTWSDGLTSGNTATVVIDVYNNAPYAYDASFSVLHDRELPARCTATIPTATLSPRNSSPAQPTAH